MSGRAQDAIEVVRAARASREPRGFGAVIRGRRSVAADLIRRIAHNARFVLGRPA